MAAQAAAAAASALLPVLFSALGEAIAAGDQAKARQLRQEAVEMFGEDILPELERFEAEQLGDTELSKVREDPRLRGSQMRALQMLEDEAFSGGMTPESQAEYAMAQQESAGLERAMRGAADTRLASRGLRTGGMALASQLSAQQAGVQRAHDAGLQTASDARMRALKALESYGGMAGDVRGQDYGIARDRAGAQDSINKFNANLRTEANRYRNEMAQAEFANKMRQRGAKAGAMDDLAEDYEGGAGRTRDQWNRWGSAAGRAASGAGKYAGGK